MRARRTIRYLKAAMFSALTGAAACSALADGLAPDPGKTHEAVVQVYGARTMGVKGLFGVHTWIAVKPTDALSWTVYEIIGWRLRWSDTALVIRERQPDAPWFGSEAQLYADKRGAGVDDLIKRIDKAARAYPYANTYTLWPGPNSNTFTAWIARQVPELQVDLPATAVGKDYIGATFVSTAPSGSGFQFTLAGLLAVAAGPVDGFELNLLGLNFGASGSGIKLPLVGRVTLPHFSESSKR
ncbi:MAG: DUF3750 domain-containing protein [Burkholderiales bacterium]